MPDSVLEYESPRDSSMRLHNAAATASVVFAAITISIIVLLAVTGRAMGGLLWLLWLIAAVATIAFGVVGRRRARMLDGVGRVKAGWGIAVGVGCTVLMVLVGVLSVWALGRSMERANRIRCTTNMRHMYYAVQLFAAEHDNAMPQKLGELQDHLGASAFVCNSSRDVPAPGPTTREVAAQLEKPQHSSYFYLGAGLRWPVAADVVLAYEDRENHEGDGIHVLFGDGTVKWYAAREAEQLLRQIKAPTTRPAQ